MKQNIGNVQAVVAGHICLDITPGFPSGEKQELREILSPGKLTNVSGVKLSTGGAVSNTGIALSILGVDTQIMGKIGKDPFGEIILKILKERSADKAMTVLEGAQTSYTVVIVPAGTDRIFLHDPAANDTFSADDINYQLVGQARLFHFGYPPAMRKMYENGGEELVEMFKKVKALGVTTSLDMCLPDPGSASGKVDWESLLADLLPYVDIFVPSIEETLYMLHRDEYIRLNGLATGRDILEVMDMNVLQELGNKVLSLGARIMTIKCGKKGYYVRTQGREALAGMGRGAPADIGNWSGRELLEEVYRVPKVVSTTGAGDTSIAGFLAAILKGCTIEDALRIACGTGAECVQTYDALSGIKSLEETVSLIRKGWKKERLSIEGGYWRYDEGGQVWYGNNDTRPNSTIIFIK